MVKADTREHYYYVVVDSDVMIVKSFNKRLLKKALSIKEAAIKCRVRHYNDAYQYALSYSVNTGIEGRPRYISLTGNDYID